MPCHAVPFVRCALCHAVPCIPCVRNTRACVPCVRAMRAYHACIPCVRAYHVCVPCVRAMCACHVCVSCVRAMCACHARVQIAIFTVLAFGYVPGAICNFVVLEKEKKIRLVCREGTFGVADKNVFCTFIMYSDCPSDLQTPADGDGRQRGRISREQLRV